MTKYRNREIIEAEQWEPGVTILGVIACDKGALANCAPGIWREIKPGDYIVKNSQHVRPGFLLIMQESDFEAQYENIGG